MLTAESHYTIAPTSESSVAIQVFKSGLMTKRKHTLFFQRYSGLVEYNHENPEMSRVELSFDANSVVCRDEWLKSDKRRELLIFVHKNVLAADRHEQVAFASERAEPQKSNPL